MPLEEKRIFHINDLISMIENTQLAVEDIVDSDLGFKMWGGKDEDGNVTKWLAKNKPARVTTLDITSGDLNMHSQDITNVLTINGVTIENHAARHQRAGADEIDGDVLDIDFTPSYYTPSIAPTSSHVDDLASHLKGIDDALNAISSGGISGLTPGAIQFGSATGDLEEDPDSLWWDDTNDFLGINRGGAAPACGIHLGLATPSHVSTDDDIFATSIEADGAIYIGTWLYGDSYDDWGIPWFEGTTKKLDTDGTNFYYTGPTFGVIATDTDTNCQIDIEAAPVYSASGGSATINITATRQGAYTADINLVSNDDILIDASEVITLESGTDKASIVLYPTANGQVRFTSNYIISNWTTPYICLCDDGAEDAQYELDFGQVSLFNALHQLYGAAGGVSEPAGQIVWGTGSGVDSEASLFWDTTNDFLGLSNSSPECGIHLGTGSPIFVSSDDDLFVDGWIEADDGVLVQDYGALILGNDIDCSIRYSLDQTADAMMIGVPATSRSIIICEQADVATDFGHALQDNPALIIQSSNAVAPSKHGKLFHDGDYFQIYSGSGSVQIDKPNGSNSSCLYLDQNNTTIPQHVLIIDNAGSPASIAYQGPYDIIMQGGVSNIHSIGVKDGRLNILACNTLADETYFGIGTLEFNTTSEPTATLQAISLDGSEYGQLNFNASSGIGSLLVTGVLSIAGEYISFSNDSLRNIKNLSFGSTPTSVGYSLGPTFDWASNKHIQTCVLTGNITSITFTAPNGVQTGLHLRFTTASGTRTINGFPGSVIWPDGDPTPISIDSTHPAICSFMYDGTYYWGTVIGGIVS